MILMRCEVCGEMVDERSDPAWLTVDSGAHVTRWGEDPGPWHVCSWPCLEALAANKIGPVPAAARP